MKYLTLVLCLLAMPVPADTTAEVGIVSTDNNFGAQARVSTSKIPFYLWGSYNSEDIRMVGQGLGDLDIIGIGIGVVKRWDDVEVFIEVGYALVDESIKDIIRQEAVYTQLVHNHESEFRPIPVYPQHPYDQDSYETSYEIDDAYIARVGIGYRVTKHIKVTAAYRMLKPEESYDLWDAESRAAGRGYWTERGDRNLDAFEVGLWYEF